MKKLLLFLAVLPIFSFSQTTITLIDFENGPWGTYVSCGPTSVCDLGSSYRTVSNIKVRATHGCPSLHTQGYSELGLTAFYSNVDGHAIGTGAVIEFNFKANYTYKITIKGGILDNILHMQMTNNPTYATDLCTFNTNAVDLSGTSNPFASFTSASFDINQNASVQFTLAQCYSYLWFSSLPKPGSDGGATAIKKVIIEEISPLSMTGPSSFCSGSVTYTLNGAQAGSNITWTSSDNTIATISASGNSATLTRTGRGFVTITATVNTVCSSLSVVNTISVGAPVSIQTTNQGCSGVYQTWLLSAVPTTNGSNWYWSVSYLGNDSQITIYSPGSPSTQVSVKGGGGVNLNFTDACGVAQQYGVTVYSTCGYGGYSYQISASPNPAKSNLNISFIPITEASNSTTDTGNTAPMHSLESKGKTIMSLYEVNTTLLARQWKYNETENNNYNLNITGLRKGIYILQVDRENQTKAIKIIIE